MDSPPPTEPVTPVAKSDSTAWIVIGLVIGLSLCACLLFTAFGGLALLPFLSTPVAAATEKPETEATTPGDSGSPTKPAIGNSEPDRFETTIGSEISPDNPGLGAGIIPQPGARDEYTFTAEAGQIIFIQTVSRPDEGIMRLTLVDDGGLEVFGTCLQCGQVGAINLDRGGTYTLIIGSDIDEGSGRYHLKLRSVEPPQNFQIAVGDTVGRDSPTEGAGYIENPGHKDIYTFTASTDQRVYFEAREAPNTNDTISWKLFDSEDLEVFSSCLQCTDPGTYILKDDTYTLQVGSDTSLGVGVYEFKLWDLVPPDEQRVVIDAVLEGNLETPGALDIFTFTADPNTVINLTTTQPIDSFIPVPVELYDSNDQIVFADCLRCLDAVSVTLDTGGQYRLIVGGNQNNIIGVYEIEITYP